MTRIPTRTTAIAAVCAVAGIGAGSVLPAGAASPSSSTGSTATAKAAAGKAKAKGKGRRGGALKRAAHLDATVATPKGFRTITIDRGQLVKADGSTLTLKEGSKKTNKDVDVAVPAGARVMRDKAAAQLSDLKTGDRVAVITGLPKGPVVRAMEPKQKP